MPPPLFEVPTLGSGIPTLGNIFINQNPLAPSYIAQVFASSTTLGGDGSASGFLGFGGGDGGLLGSSSLSNIFTSAPLPDAQDMNIFDDQLWDRSLGSNMLPGAPSLVQQLHALQLEEQLAVHDLALALRQMGNITPKAEHLRPAVIDPVY